MITNCPTFRKKILICDDDAIFSKVLAAILKEYTIETAYTGHDALRKLHTFSPDLLLLDVQMNDLNGFEVCTQVRADPRCPFVKIVFVSGNITLADRMSGYEAGGDDYITKPFDTQEFLAKIRVLLRLKAIEEVDQIKRDFITLISHETRTPLTVMRSATELLLDSGDTLDATRRRGFLESIYSSVNRLSRLSERTLLACTLSDLRQTTLPALRIFSASEILKEILENVGDSAEDLEISFAVEIEDETLEGHRGYVADALTFIVENAIRFSPKGGTVVINGRHEQGSYCFTVCDQGMGIPLERLEQIFELFSIKDILDRKSVV